VVAVVKGIPKSFVLARIHSLMGLGIVIFLIEHLITNSQAALFIGDDGIGFIRMVNFLHGLPYLQALEVMLIGVPILFHAVMGIRIALKGRANSIYSNGTKPLMQFARNHAYTWQRVTSWILLVGIILHVSYMRFMIYPIKATENKQSYFLTRLSMDSGLYTLTDRLGARLFNQEAIVTEKNSLASMASKMTLVSDKMKEMKSSADSFNLEEASMYDSLQRFQEKKDWVLALERRPVGPKQIIAVCPNFGVATLLNVRDAFKDPIKCGLYTAFVLAAVFHGFNGLWTFLITWGAIVRMGSQKAFSKICMLLMFLFAFLGLAAVWGTYWINLRS
jgi:succinate dehydrogenase / fumarate reductase cytochrome b subunit